MTKKSALITGGAQGMGQEFAKLLLDLNFLVWIVDQDQQALKKIHSQFTSQINSGQLLTTCLDLCDSTALDHFAQTLKSQWLSLDLLVNNAGIVFGGPFQNVSIAEHSRTIDVNLKALIATTHHFLPLLQKSQDSTLLQMASVTGLMGLAYGSSYSASKWGVIGFSEALREELRSNRQRAPHICIVCPSYIDTGMFDGSKHPKFMPKLSSAHLASKILNGALKGKNYIYAPYPLRWLPLLKALLPLWAQAKVMDFLGVASGMRSWTGRPKIGA